MKHSLPKIVLHLEGLELLLMALFLFHWFHGNWWLFAALLLVPDVGMFGYLVNTKVGSITYNIFHTATIPALIMVVLFLSHVSLLTAIPFLAPWVAHIGMDRVFGFGLKYPAHFKDTHLQHV